MNLLKLGVCAAAMFAASGAGIAQDDGSKPEPPEATDALLELEPLVGRWYMDLSEYDSEAGKAWLERNRITDLWVEMRWGTDRRWIEFGDYRMVAGEERKQAAGLIAFSHASMQIEFTERGAREAAVDGVIRRESDTRFVRDIAVLNPVDGWRQVDVWELGERENCIKWTTTIIRGAERTERPSFHYCRRD